MAESILDDVKQALGLAPDYLVFDRDVIMHINSTFMTLNQLGVGPVEGYAIQDKVSEWPEFLGTDLRLNAVKSYMYMKVRLMFDPPTTSFGISAVENQIKELEWRLNVVVDTVDYSTTET